MRKGAETRRAAVATGDSGRSPNSDAGALHIFPRIFRRNMNIIEPIRMAVESVRSNLLRTALTLLSIAIGIFAIIGAGTAIASLDSSVSTELTSLGQNTFAVTLRPSLTMTRASRRKYARRKPITYEQAQELQSRMQSAGAISSFLSSGGYTVKADNLSTDPDVTVQGTDPAYFETNNIDIEAGRALSGQDVSLSRPVAIIGADIVAEVFPSVSPLGREIALNGRKFTVVGILESQGAVLGQSQDNQVIIPISLYTRIFASEWRQSVKIYIKAPAQPALQETIDEAIGILRTLRNVQPGEDNDFEIETNDSLTNQFASFSQYLESFGLMSGVFALLAAGVGIMNIMLVSVKERTREIGVRKAIGAKKGAIIVQFVIEAIVLCQFGGIIGVLLGITGGALLSSAIGISLAVPWSWVAGSVIICTVLGVAFGLYPAWKAAQLDPIESLRYE